MEYPILTFLMLSGLLVFVVLSKLDSQGFNTALGEPKDMGLGYFAFCIFFVLFVVLVESISAVLSLFKIKDDLAEEIYNKDINKK